MVNVASQPHSNLQPWILDPVPIGNSIQLIGIEGNLVKTKDKGYWSQVFLLECEGEHNTFWKPACPPQFDVIHCTTGGWTTQFDTKMLGVSFCSSPSSMDTSSSLGTSTNNKGSWTSFVSHNEDYQHLLIENVQLCKKLEAAKAQQKALDIENGELKIKGATLEKDNHVMLCDLHAAQKANMFGNTTLQSIKLHLKEVKTQV